MKAEFAEKAGISSTWGSGIPKLMEAMQEYGLQEPEFRDMEIGFRINLYRNTEDSNMPTNQENNQELLTNQETDQETNQELSINQETNCPIGERFYEADLERQRLVIQSLSQVLRVTVDEEQRLQEAAVKTKGTAENLRKEILRTEQCLKQNAVEKMQFYERYADGSLFKEEFLVIRNKIVQETESLEKEKAALEEQLSALEQNEDTELKELAEEASSFLKAENVTNEMLRLFIDKVYVYAGMRIEIVYRFQNPFQTVEASAADQTDSEQVDSQS